MTETSLTLDKLLQGLQDKAGVTSAGSTRNAISNTEDRFLRLLTAQMQAQNPLSPLDNAQVTSQLAQISTVNGIDQLNNTLLTLLNSNSMTQALAAAGVVGHGVLVPGDSIVLGEGEARLGVELAQPADRVTITIKDSSGRVVRTLELGAQEDGVLPVTWDGLTDSGATAAPGNYTFSVSATRGSEDVSATALAYGKVEGLTYSANGLIAIIAGLGRVSLDELREIL
ncbi:MAG: flagellar hook assembly protein FlgD [Betaproteobacteria bacterium]|nr:flagellar hook assembly protein FlgD [Betaproteobacteria bacterium]